MEGVLSVIQPASQATLHEQPGSARTTMPPAPPPELNEVLLVPIRNVQSPISATVARVYVVTSELASTSRVSRAIGASQNSTVVEAMPPPGAARSPISIMVTALASNAVAPFSEIVIPTRPRVAWL